MLRPVTNATEKDINAKQWWHQVTIKKVALAGMVFYWKHALELPTRRGFRISIGVKDKACYNINIGFHLIHLGPQNKVRNVVQGYVPVLTAKVFWLHVRFGCNEGSWECWDSMGLVLLYDTRTWDCGIAYASASASGHGWRREGHGMAGYDATWETLLTLFTHCTSDLVSMAYGHHATRNTTEW